MQRTSTDLTLSGKTIIKLVLGVEGWCGESEKCPTIVEKNTRGDSSVLHLLVNYFRVRDFEFEISSIYRVTDFNREDPEFFCFADVDGLMHPLIGT